MLTQLEWIPLAVRREHARLGMFYKMVNGLVLVNIEDNLIPQINRSTRQNCNQQQYSLSASIKHQIPLKFFFPKNSDVMELASLNIRSRLMAAHNV